jgi:hypothetical protein
MYNVFMGVVHSEDGGFVGLDEYVWFWTVWIGDLGLSTLF